MKSEGKAKISYYPNFFKFYFDEVLAVFRSFFGIG